MLLLFFFQQQLTPSFQNTHCLKQGFDALVLCCVNLKVKDKQRFFSDLWTSFRLLLLVFSLVLEAAFFLKWNFVTASLITDPQSAAQRTRPFISRVSVGEERGWALRRGCQAPPFVLFNEEWSSWGVTQACCCSGGRIKQLPAMERLLNPERWSHLSSSTASWSKNPLMFHPSGGCLWTTWCVNVVFLGASVWTKPLI